MSVLERQIISRHQDRAKKIDRHVFPSFFFVFLVQQMGPPKISFSKRQFMVGEKLLANCTTSKARPAPHITWLINGKKVCINICL